MLDFIRQRFHLIYLQVAGIPQHVRIMQLRPYKNTEYLGEDGWLLKELLAVIHGAERVMIRFLIQIKNKTDCHSQESEESLFYIYNLKLKI